MREPTLSVLAQRFRQANEDIMDNVFGLLSMASRRSATRLAFVTCKGDSKLLVVDLRTGHTTATLEVPEGPDVLAFASGLQRLYVACESGSLAVFEERDHSLTSLGVYHAPHAHTVAVDPGTHRVYLPLQDVEGKPVLRILVPSGQ